MLYKRLLVAVICVPLILACIYWGQWVYLALLLLTFGLAEIEYCRLNIQAGFRPAGVFGLGLVWFLLVEPYLHDFYPHLDLWRLGLAILILSALAWYVIRSDKDAFNNWALTIAGGLYLGLCGAFLVLLRRRPDGLWWTMVVAIAVFAGDSGAYFVGRKWGRHALAPAISPGKTWEGYWAGVMTGGVSAAFVATLWRMGMDSQVPFTGWHGLFVGMLIELLSPLGDLTVSVLKRKAKCKNSSDLIPGHGGFLDKLDSVLWGGVIAYVCALCIGR